MTFIILRYYNLSYYSRLYKLHCCLQSIIVFDATAVSFRVPGSNYDIQFVPGQTPSSLDDEVVIDFSPVLVSRVRHLCLHQSLFEHPNE